MALKRHQKTQKIYYPENKLVVRSNTEKIVIGRIDNDIFIPLDDEAIRLCEEHNLKYDESLVENSNDQEEDEQVSKSESKESVKEPVKQVSKEVAKEVIKDVTVTSKEVSSKDTTRVKSAENNLLSDIAKCNTQITKLISDYQSKSQQELENATKEIETLREKLSLTEKKLTETTKKLKNVLLAMQSDLDKDI